MILIPFSFLHIPIISDIFDFVSNLVTNQSNQDIAHSTNVANAEQTRETNEANERINQLSLDNAKWLLSQQQAFNSETAQAQRLRAAGINPALNHVGAGSINVSNPSLIPATTGAPAVTGAPMQPFRTSDIDAVGSFKAFKEALNVEKSTEMIGKSMAQIDKSIEINNEQIKLLRSQGRINSEEYRKLKFENTMLERLKENQIKSSDNQIEFQNWSISNLIAQNNAMHIDAAIRSSDFEWAKKLRPLQQQNLVANTQNLFASAYQAAMNGQLSETQVKNYAYNILEQIGRASNSFSQSDLNKALKNYYHDHNIRGWIGVGIQSVQAIESIVMDVLTRGVLGKSNNKSASPQVASPYEMPSYTDQVVSPWNIGAP